MLGVDLFASRCRPWREDSPCCAVCVYAVARISVQIRTFTVQPYALPNNSWVRAGNGYFHRRGLSRTQQTHCFLFQRRCVKDVQLPQAVRTTERKHQVSVSFTKRTRKMTVSNADERRWIVPFQRPVKTYKRNRRWEEEE